MELSSLSSPTSPKSFPDAAVLSPRHMPADDGRSFAPPSRALLVFSIADVGRLRIAVRGWPMDMSAIHAQCAASHLNTVR